MKPIPKLLKLMLLWGVLCLFASVNAHATGSVINLSGPLLVKKPDGAVKVLSIKSEVQQGDTLISEKNTYARIKFLDSSEITLQPNTQFKIEKFAFDEAKPDRDNAFFTLLRGGLRSITGALGKRSHDKIIFNTPTATVGIRGTTFIMEYIEPSNTDVAKMVPTYPQLAAVSDTMFLATDVRSDAPPTVIPSPVYMQLAQSRPGQGGGLAPGLYVHVIDGLIQLSNRGGVQQFAAGQFGFTGSVVQPPVIVPNNPGIQFNPPPAFQSSTGPQSSSGNATKPKTVDCEIR